MPQVKATVRIEVIVPVGAWDGKSSFDEIREQVKREGLEIVRKVAHEQGWIVSNRPGVVAIVVEEQRGEW